MTTVYENVVSKLTRTGREIGRHDGAFYSTTYDLFVNRVWTDRASTGGLPPEVFVRALKAAFRDVTGQIPPPSPKAPVD